MKNFKTSKNFSLKAANEKHENFAVERKMSRFDNSKVIQNIYSSMHENLSRISLSYRTRPSKQDISLLILHHHHVVVLLLAYVFGFEN